MLNERDEKRTDVVFEFKEGNVSLILDSYDDIFSDFDPRSYSERALSDDFLSECKKAARDKEDRLELRFLIPKQKRNYRDEIKIKKRLKDHFHRHFLETNKKINKIKMSGLIWFILGAIVMTLGTFLYSQRDNGFLFTFLFIMSEPAGWFFFWEGLAKIFITSKKELPDYEFYKKMSKSEIVFLDY